MVFILSLCQLCSQARTSSRHRGGYLNSEQNESRQGSGAALEFYSKRSLAANVETSHSKVQGRPYSILRNPSLSKLGKHERFGSQRLLSNENDDGHPGWVPDFEKEAQVATTAGDALPVEDDSHPVKQLREAYVSCINAHQPQRDVTTWDSAMADELSAVRIDRAWWSRKPESPIQMTIVTQLSLNRLQQLSAMCKSWPGPVSAVVYVATLAPMELAVAASGGLNTSEPLDTSEPQPSRRKLLQQAAVTAAGRGHRAGGQRALSMDPEVQRQLNLARHTLQRLFSWTEEDPSRCRLDVTLAYEMFDSQKAMVLYPVNVLRNYARLAARTPLLGLFDADMLPSASMAQGLMQQEDVRQLLNLTGIVSSGSSSSSPERRRGVVVIPAFITQRTTYYSAAFIADHVACNASKAQMQPLYESRILQRFDPLGAGHAATKYRRWFRAVEPYHVAYKDRYEPWVVAARKFNAPPAAAGANSDDDVIYDDPCWHDSAFRGYGQNKIVQLACLNATGYDFWVHHQHFLIHRHHKTTRVKLMHAEDFLQRRGKSGFEATVYGHTMERGRLSRQAMAAGTYRPTLDPATLACRKELPWWQ